jgi:membrane protein implicated in regulation of membrane protease activity
MARFNWFKLRSVLMSESTVWWLLSGLLVALELFTGTFYLLMLALGTIAAALAAHAGAGTALQLVAGAVVGSTAVVAWYLAKRRRPADPSVRSMRSVNLDIGELIQVDEWAEDGTASVKYRGAQWRVIQRPGNAPIPGMYRVAELVGNRLLVEKV